MLNGLATLATKHAKKTLLVTLVFTLVSGALGSQAFSVLKSEGFNDPQAQSTTAQQLIDSQYGGATNLVVLVRNEKGTVDEPVAKAAAQTVSSQLQKNSTISNVVSFSNVPVAALRSRDNHFGIITAHIAGDSERVTKIAHDLELKLSSSRQGVSVSVGGLGAVSHDINQEVGKSLGIAESIAIPLTILFLLLAFGTVVSASLPLLTALIAIIVTFAELFVLGKITDVSIYAINLTTALGLGLAVDYGLFVVSRYREELREGKSIDSALEATIKTAGRTVLFSSTAVVAALLAMTIFPLYFLSSFAYAGVGVVVVSAVSALVVLPALLKVLGPRIEKGKLPWAARVNKTEAPSWQAIARFVMKRPVITALPALILLLVLAMPLRHIAFGMPDDRVLHNSIASRQVSNTLRENFPGSVNSQLNAVITGDNNRQASQIALQQITKINGVLAVQSQLSRSSESSLLTIQTNIDPQSKQAKPLVDKIRAVSLPNGSKLFLGGASALQVDTKHAIAKRLAFGAAIIAVTTYIVLFLFTGSILQPLRALVTNLLTLAASFGILVWIFQDGHLASLLNFTPQPINLTMPVLLFCISFGLSMDYEVFLLSRIKEQHAQGASTIEAVAHGLSRAGRIISTAAIMLAISFFAFGAASISFLQLFGIGTGVAIVLDATLVRAILVPAFMKLVGSAAWYSPGPLQRFHARFGLRD